MLLQRYQQEKVFITSHCCLAASRAFPRLLQNVDSLQKRVSAQGVVATLATSLLTGAAAFGAPWTASWVLITDLI